MGKEHDPRDFGGEQDCQSSAVGCKRSFGDGEEPSKIMLIGSMDQASDVLLSIRESIRTFSNATFSKTNYLEILPAGVNKAKIGDPYSILVFLHFLSYLTCRSSCP